jgi:hypothetical protein
VGKRFLPLVLLLFCVSPAVFACSCVESGSAPCGAQSADAVVFVGTVMHIDNPAPDDGGLGGSGESHYTFHIDEELAGTQGQR